MSNRPTDKRFQRSRERALRAAFELLSSDGLEAVTHQNVAAAADIGRATMYRHWTTRTDLIVDVLVAAVPPIEFDGLDPELTPSARIQYRLLELRNRLDGPFASVLITLIAQGDYDDTLRRVRLQSLQPALDALEDDLQEMGVAYPAERAHALVGSMFARRFVFDVTTTDEDIDRIVAATGCESGGPGAVAAG